MIKELSVIILSKNEEDVIAEAVKSAKDFAKEILVVDAFSTDNTVQLAKTHGATVVQRRFEDFSDQRNYALSHINTEWVLYLDADEQLTSDFKSEVKKILEKYDSDSPITAFYVKRHTFYYGHDWNFEDNVQRLFRRDKLVHWYGKVHETPKIEGDFGQINSPILHFTHRNLSQMVRKTNEWSEYEAQLRLEASHPSLAPWRFFRVMATEFFHSYIKNKGYKNGTLGLIEAMYQAFSIFITYAKLWELQQKKTSKK